MQTQSTNDNRVLGFGVVGTAISMALIVAAVSEVPGLSWLAFLGAMVALVGGAALTKVFNRMDVEDNCARIQKMIDAQIVDAEFEEVPKTFKHPGTAIVRSAVAMYPALPGGLMLGSQVQTGTILRLKA